MRIPYSRSPNAPSGTRVTPLNLDKWYALAVLTAEDLVAEFLNVYGALNSPLPLSKPDQTQEEFEQDLPVSPEKPYVLPTDHWEEHLQLRWALRVRGDTQYWFQQPASVESIVEFIVPSPPPHTYPRALKYKVVWSGETPPDIVLQEDADTELFAIPTLVILENANPAADLTVGIRVGNGAVTHVIPLLVPAGDSEAIGLGGGQKPTTLELTAIPVNPLPPALRDQTQAEFVEEESALPVDDVYPIPTNHFQEHKQLRWALRVRGNAPNWCDVPDIPAYPLQTVHTIISPANDNLTCQEAALYYNIQWPAGTEPPNVILQGKNQKTNFPAPTIIMLLNGNQQPIQVSFRLASGGLGTIHLPNGEAKFYAIGGSGSQTAATLVASRAIYAQFAENANTLNTEFVVEKAKLAILADTATVATTALTANKVLEGSSPVQGYVNKSARADIADSVFEGSLPVSGYVNKAALALKVLEGPVPVAGYVNKAALADTASQLPEEVKSVRGFVHHAEIADNAQQAVAATYATLAGSANLASVASALPEEIAPVPGYVKKAASTDVALLANKVLEGPSPVQGYVNKSATTNVSLWSQRTKQETFFQISGPQSYDSWQQPALTYLVDATCSTKTLYLQGEGRTGLFLFTDTGSVVENDLGVSFIIANDSPTDQKVSLLIDSFSRGKAFWQQLGMVPRSAVNLYQAIWQFVNGNWQGGYKVFTIGQTNALKATGSLYDTLLYQVTPGTPSAISQDLQAFIYQIQPYDGDELPPITLGRPDGSPLFHAPALFMIENLDSRGIVVSLVESASQNWATRRVEISGKIFGALGTTVMVIMQPDHSSVVMNFSELANNRTGYNELYNAVAADRRDASPTQCALLNMVYGDRDEPSMYPVPSVAQARSYGSALYDDPALSCFVGAGYPLRANLVPDLRSQANQIDITLNKQQSSPVRMALGNEPLLMGLVGNSYEPGDAVVAPLGYLTPATLAVYTLPVDYRGNSSLFQPLPRALLYIVPADLVAPAGGVVYLYRSPQMGEFGPPPGSRWAPLYDNGAIIWLKNLSEWAMTFVNGNNGVDTVTVAPNELCCCVIGNTGTAEPSFSALTRGVIV